MLLLLFLLIVILILVNDLFFVGKLFTARWMTTHETNQLLPRINFKWRHRVWIKFKAWLGIKPTLGGFCIGQRQLSLQKSFVHMVVVGATGSGKTQKVILPTAISNPSASLVITDPSGEIFTHSSGYLYKKGYAIKTLDFRKETVGSYAYNPLHCSGDLSLLKMKIERLYDASYLNTTGSSDNGVFWKNSCVNLLFALAWFLSLKEDKHNNLANLRYLLQRFTVAPMDVLHQALALKDYALIRELEVILKSDAKVLQNTLSTAQSVLGLLADKHVAHITGASNFDLSELRQQKTALYIITPEADTKYFSPITALLYMDLFSMVQQGKKKGEPYVPILMLLDEAANTGVIQGGRFATLLATCRKKEVGVLIALQSISQVYQCVGKHEAETILSNCVSKLYLAGMDDFTAQQVSQKTGMTAAKYTGVDDTTLHESSRALITSDELQTLPEDRGLFFHHNKRPALLKLSPAYKQQQLKRRMRVKGKFELPKLPQKIELLPLPKYQPSDTNKGESCPAKPKGEAGAR